VKKVALSVWLLALFFISPRLSQAQKKGGGANSVTFFGGALFGDGNGFGVGAEVSFPLTNNVDFEPSLLIGRIGDNSMFSLDGSFLYNFRIRDSKIVPYVLGGVGLAQFGSATHGSPIIGAGARFPLNGSTEIRPEIRAGTAGLARFTIGITKRF
jgi:hypothetical protein